MKKFLILLLLVGLLKGMVWAITFPIFQAPDEQAHYSYVQYWVENKEIPRAPFEEKNFGLSSHLKNTINRLESFNIRFNPTYSQPFEEGSLYGPHEELIQEAQWDPRPTQDYFAYNYAPGYYALLLPSYILFRGEVLQQAMAMRWTSVLLSLVMIFLIYRAIEIVFKKPWIAFAGTLIVMFQPMFSTFSSVINNDLLLNLAYAGFFMSALKTLDTQKALSGKQISALSGWTLLGILSKTQGYGLLILFALLILFKIKRQKKTWKELFIAALLFIGAGVALPWILPGGFTRFTYYKEYFHEHSLLEFIHYTRIYIWNVFESFWGRFGWLDTTISTSTLWVLAIVCGISVIGLLIHFKKSRKKDRTTLYLLISILLIGGFYLFYFWDNLLTSHSFMNAQAIQGRYYFILMVPIFVLGIKGWITLFARKHQKFVLIMLAFSMMIFHFMTLGTIIPRYYATANEQIAGEAQTIKLNPSQTIGQTFTTLDENLQGIKIVIEPTQYPLKGEAQLLESPGGEVLLARSFRLRMNQNLLEIPFKNLELDAGKTLYLELTANDTNKQAIPVLQADTPYNGGALYMNSEPYTEDMVFETHYQNTASLGERLITLSQHMSQYKPWWTKSPYLFLYWGLYILAVAATCRLLVKDPKNAP